MTHAAALAQHILSLQPEKDAARLSFYQYLQNLVEPNQPVTSELINRFYLRALSFAHWQQNKQALFFETESILRHYQDSHHVQLAVGANLRPHDLQVIPVESIDNLEIAVNRFLESAIVNGAQFRLIRDMGTGGERILAVVLNTDQSLTVTVYPKILALYQGELEPLHQDFNLHYTQSLELKTGVRQQVEVGPHASAHFRLGADGYRGTVVRGFTFQKYASIEGGGLHSHPLLFYPLKRIEQFFVNRKTDPMYIELTGLLEKALDMLSLRDPASVSYAQAALERGRLALNHIYSDDKLMRLLLENIEKTLALQANGANYARPQTRVMTQANTAPSSGQIRTFEEPEGLDLLEKKDEAWPATHDQVRNLPV